MLMAIFLSIKTEACKPPHTPDLGAFVRAQIETHQPASVIAFTIPDVRTGNVVLASDAKGNRIVGDARWWRVNILEHLDLLEKAARRRERRISQWKPNAKTLNRPIIVVGRMSRLRSWIALPLMGAKGASWKKPPAENLVDLLAHLAFGTATAIVSEELAVQSDRGPTSDRHRRAARVG